MWAFLLKFSRSFPDGLIINKSTLGQIMAWERTGDKPLPDPWRQRSLTAYGVSRPQWVFTGHFGENNSTSHGFWLPLFTHCVTSSKWSPFYRLHFEIYFLKWKLLYNDSLSIKSRIDKESILVHVMIGCLLDTSGEPLHELMNTYFINILRPRQNSRHFADSTFKSIFMNENVWT